MKIIKDTCAVMELYLGMDLIGREIYYKAITKEKNGNITNGKIYKARIYKIETYKKEDGEIISEALTSYGVPIASLTSISKGYEENKFEEGRGFFIYAKNKKKLKEIEEEIRKELAENERNNIE